MFKSLCVLPSRYDSQRLPGKPLLQILGKSLIQRVWEQVKAAKLFDRIVVATDDIRIQEHAKSFGAEVMMTSEDCASGTERLLEVAQKLDDYDIYVNVQGDEPLIPHQLLKDCLQVLESVSGEWVCTASTDLLIEDIQDPNSVKLITDNNGNALYFSRAPIPFSRKGEWKAEMHRKHIGLYGFTSQGLSRIRELKSTKLEEYEQLEQLRWLYHGIAIKVIPTSYQAQGVDVAADIKKVEAIISDRQKDAWH